MARGGAKWISIQRAEVTVVAALLLVLTSFFPVPHHAMAAAAQPAAQVAHPHDPVGALHDHQASPRAELGQADLPSNDCADHLKSQAHGGACCQLSFHAALPAPVAPLALPRLDVVIAGVASIPLAAQRMILIERPPRARA